MVNLPFLKKKSKAPAGHPGASERVRELSAQGLSEAEILRSMRAEGYGPGEVDSAMKDVLRESVAGPPRQPPAQPPAQPPRRQPAPEYGEPPSAPSPRKPVPEYGEAPPKPGSLEMAEFPPGRFAPPEEPEEPAPPARGWRPPESAPPPPAPLPPSRSPEEEYTGEEEFAPLPPPPGARRGPSERGEMEEIAESIVDEKMRSLEGQISELSRRLDSLSSKVASIESMTGRGGGTGMEEVKAGLESYKSSIGELSERTEAMERAIKDSLTPMMQSLRSLSETIKTLKEKRG